MTAAPVIVFIIWFAIWAWVIWCLFRMAREDTSKDDELEVRVPCREQLLLITKHWMRKGYRVRSKCTGWFGYGVDMCCGKKKK